MADAVVQVAPDGSGKMVDNSSLTVGANTVYRQRLNIADPTTAAGLAVVINTTPSGSEYGLGVRLVGPLPSGTNTIGLVGLVSSFTGVGAPFRPDGLIRVAMDASSLLLDTFETLDTANTWTTANSGTGSGVTGAAGNLIVAGGTAASSYGSITSKATFINGATAFTNYTSAWVIDAAAVTGNKRVFGLGIVNPTPTTSAPITNGVVFELQDTDGSMVGAVYSNGVRTATVPITRPTDGGAHRYAIFFRASRVYFEVDSNASTTYSIALPNPQVDALAAVAVSINASSGNPGTSPTLACSVVGIADTGRNNQQISDGTYAWRKATVKPAYFNATAADTALVVTPHPGAAAFISSGNSSTTTLGVGGVFTGLGEDVSIYAQATISVFANQVSATDGLSVQQSTDNTNWDFFDVYTIPASTGKNFTIPVQAKFLRVVYTNGGVTQTAFRLQTIYSSEQRRGSAVRPQDGRSNENDMEEVASYMSAFNGTSWDRVRIKPASTAAVATDQAIVTTPHPSGIHYVQGVQGPTTTGSITTSSTIVGPINMNGYNVVTVAISGTFVGVSLVFEGSMDNTTYFPLQGSRVDTGQVGTGLTAASTSTVAFDIPIGAWQYFRVRSTAYTSGTALVAMGAQSLPFDPCPAAIAQGDIQSGATDSSSAPVKIGGQARTTNPTAVTDGQRTNAIFDKLGKQVVVGAIRDLKARQRTNIAASTAETTIITAGAAGVFNDVYGFVITNNGTAVMSVTIRDVAAGTPVSVFQIPASDTRGIMLPVDSAIPQATAASAWTATCTPNAISVDITALYVKNT